MQKTTKRALRALTLALIAMLLCQVALAASYSAKVLASNTGFYVSTQSGKQLAGSLKRGTSIKVSSISGEWAKISYKGHSGYAKLEDIIFNKKTPAVVTKDASLKFVTRKSYEEGKYYKATIAKGTKVYVVGKDGKDALVSNGDGSALGYMKMSALKKVK